MASRWKNHVEKWKDCSLCSLCEGRNRVVLARGKVPCDVLFIGEAPGINEDVLGRPFEGPAGKLLDQLVGEALAACPGQDLRLAYTNLVGCIPRPDKGSKKFKEPPAEAIEACAPRLNELVCMCKPRLIVLVGKLAEKAIEGQAQFGPEWEGEMAQVIEFLGIVHPAAILRAEVVRRELMCQKQVVYLETAFKEL